jgi:hypothetical protein
MITYPKDVKDAVIKRLIELHKSGPAPAGALAAIAAEAGVPANTLYQWNSDLKRRQARAAGALGSSGNLSAAAKFQAVVATASMSELELGEYLRKNAITKEDLERWRRVCEGANEPRELAESNYRSQLAAERARNREMERELKRKEKALAEAAALLVLSKKAQVIWGDRGEG